MRDHVFLDVAVGLDHDVLDGVADHVLRIADVDLVGAHGVLHLDGAADQRALLARLRVGLEDGPAGGVHHADKVVVDRVAPGVEHSLALGVLEQRHKACHVLVGHGLDRGGADGVVGAVVAAGDFTEGVGGDLRAQPPGDLVDQEGLKGVDRHLRHSVGDVEMLAEILAGQGYSDEVVDLVVIGLVFVDGVRVALHDAGVDRDLEDRVGAVHGDVAQDRVLFFHARPDLVGHGLADKELRAVGFVGGGGYVGDRVALLGGQRMTEVGAAQQGLEEAAAVFGRFARVALFLGFARGRFAQGIAGAAGDAAALLLHARCGQTHLGHAHADVLPLFVDGHKVLGAQGAQLHAVDLSGAGFELGKGHSVDLLFHGFTLHFSSDLIAAARFSSSCRFCASALALSSEARAPSGAASCERASRDVPS